MIKKLISLSSLLSKRGLQKEAAHVRHLLKLAVDDNIVDLFPNKDSSSEYKGEAALAMLLSLVESIVDGSFDPEPVTHLSPDLPTRDTDERRLLLRAHRAEMALKEIKYISKQVLEDSDFSSYGIYKDIGPEQPAQIEDASEISADIIEFPMVEGEQDPNSIDDQLSLDLKGPKL